jgi:hypothetical protein
LALKKKPQNVVPLFTKRVQKITGVRKVLWRAARYLIKSYAHSEKSEKESEKGTDLFIGRFLDTPEAIAAYLAESMKADDTKSLCPALAIQITTSK